MSLPVVEARRSEPRVQVSRHLVTGGGLYARMLAGEPGLACASLRALTRAASYGFATVVALRNRLYDAAVPPFVARHGPIPVVSVGNLSTGGTGKSVVAAALAERLIALGVRPAIVARGYRAGVSPARAVAGAANGDEARAGDEALEQRRRLGGAVSVICNPDRLAGVVAAAAADAQVAILDDGFQHRRLARDLDLVCIDLLQPRDAAHLLPRGLLREPLSSLRRAHLVLLTRADLAGDEAIAAAEQEVRATGFGGGIVPAAHRPARLRDLAGGLHAAELKSLRDAAVVLVSGLGNPAGFFATIQQLGARVTAHVMRPDHHPWTPRDIGEIRALARAPGTLVVTTGKDAVKLAPLAPAEPWLVLEVELAILRGEADVDAALRKLVGGSSGGGLCPPATPRG